jgi:hypothetical protein
MLGRFMGIDPVGVSDANIHSHNRYAYANNNPYKYQDPDGKWGFLIAWAFEAYEAAQVTTGLAIISTPGQIALGAAAGITGASATGYEVQTAAVAAQDAAFVAQAAGRTNGVAAGLAKNGKVFSDVSTSAKRVNEPAVQKALDSVPESVKSAYHGQCAEIGCLNQAIKAGVNPSGGSMKAVKIRAAGNAAHGATKEACGSCAHVMDQLGVKN